LIRSLRSSNDNDSVGELLVYDERGVERYYRIDGFIDGHDVAWDGREFLAVSTLTNSILWISPAGEITRTWQAPGEGDAWHLNCLLLKDGQTYVSAFGRLPHHREWVQRRAEPLGIIFNLSTGQDVLTGLYCPHHPRYFDGAWAVCNSVNRDIVQIDEASGVVLRKVQLGGWTRGVAVSDDYMFVGESAHRYNCHQQTTSHIAVICRKNWALLDRFPVPCREIYDLLLVPLGLLEGARHGFRTNSLRVAEQNQYAMFDEVGIKPARLWATGEPLPVEACRVQIEAELPRVLKSNTEIELECGVENRGGALLSSSPPHPVHISYKWIEADTGAWRSQNEGLRTRLPRVLPPGQPIRCRFKVKTLAETGEFILRVSLVQEHVAWFDDVDPRNACSRPVRIVEAESGAISGMIIDAIPSRRSA
jgi:hypothetical protein